ncbi:MAG: type II toxin-antitoxin system RelE/ParE family toxin [Longimicrobiales bacterium]
MTARFIVRPEAEADIDEAYAWYEGRSSGLGERFLGAVDEALIAIRNTPQRFPRMHQDADLIVRRGLVKRFPYGLFFIWDETRNATSIIACLHVRQEPRRWLRRAR